VFGSSSGAAKREHGDRKHTRSRPRPREAVVAAALEAVADEATCDRLRNENAIAVVIQVPTASWVAPVASYLRKQGTWEIFARDGSSRSGHRPGVANDEVSGALTAGMRVLGVSQRPDALLPSALTSAADLTIVIAQPNGAVLRDALRRAFAGYVPVRIDDSLLAGKDLDTIVAAMRPGSRPGDVVKRLQAAARRAIAKGSANRLPDLAAAIEYGAAREWGMALAADISDYRAGRIAWSEVDRGAVLHSPPGCGKSLYARMLASACGMPLVATSVSEFFASSSGDLDGVIKAQRAVFTQAAESAPCILFLDEIDAIPDRRTMSPRGRDWWTPVINDFLLLLDAAVAGQREGVVVVGATNMIDHVDPAILRPGRLERSIEISRPDAAGAINILRHHLAGELADVNLSRLGPLLAGATGAEIMEKVRAARRIARRAQREMTEADLFAAIVPANTLPPAKAYRAAVHEAGHAIVGLATGGVSVRNVLLTSQANSHGATTLAMDLILPTRSSLEDYIVGVLGGRAAELVCIGSISTGAGGNLESDLGIATSTAASLHAAYGLGRDLVLRSSAHNALDVLERDPTLRRMVECDLRRLQRRADDLARQHRDAIILLAKKLIRDRHVTGEEVMRIFLTTQPSATGMQAASLH